MDEGNGKYNLIVLCWDSGQGSAIHDHADSHCFMKVSELGSDLSLPVFPSWVSFISICLHAIGQLLMSIKSLTYSTKFLQGLTLATHSLLFYSAWRAHRRRERVWHTAIELPMHAFTQVDSLADRLFKPLAVTQRLFYFCFVFSAKGISLVKI